MGLASVDDAAVGRHAHLTFGQGVKRIDGLVRRHTRGQVHQYLHAARCQVLHLARLYLPLVDGLDDAVAHRSHRLAVRNRAYGQSAVVHLLNLGAHPYRAAPLPVVVLGHIHQAPRLEVGIQAELLAVQVAHRRVAQLVEVVRQYLRREPHGDALHPLRQQQGELHGQGHRFPVAPVVREFPLRCLGVEHHLQGKLRQARLDVPRRRRAVARQDVSPVALAIHQQFLLPQLHQRVAYAGVAVRVELHGVPHDVGHLVVASVLHAAHGVQYAPLHRLQAVHDVGHGPLQNHIRGVVQEPVLVHAVQLVHIRISHVDRIVFRSPPANRIFHKCIGICRRYISICRRRIGIVCRHTGIFRRRIGIICRHNGIFRRRIGIVCRHTGIFRRRIGIVCRHTGIFRRQWRIHLFCRRNRFLRGLHRLPVRLARLLLGLVKFFAHTKQQIIRTQKYKIKSIPPPLFQCFCPFSRQEGCIFSVIIPLPYPSNIQEDTHRQS